MYEKENTLLQDGILLFLFFIHESMCILKAYWDARLFLDMGGISWAAFHSNWQPFFIYEANLMFESFFNSICYAFLLCIHNCTLNVMKFLVTRPILMLYIMLSEVCWQPFLVWEGLIFGGESECYICLISMVVQTMKKDIGIYLQIGSLWKFRTGTEKLYFHLMVVILNLKDKGIHLNFFKSFFSWQYLLPHK